MLHIFQTSGMSALDTMSPVLGDQSAALHYNDVWKLEDTMLSTSSASSSTDPVISTDNSYLKDNNKDQSKFSSGQLPNKSTTPDVRLVAVRTFILILMCLSENETLTQLKYV